MRLAGEVAELGHIEDQPELDGRNMVMVLAPKKVVGQKDRAADDAETEVKSATGS